VNPLRVSSRISLMGLSWMGAGEGNSILAHSGVLD
jgi:hypothetical protein